MLGPDIHGVLHADAQRLGDCCAGPAPEWAGGVEYVVHDRHQQSGDHAELRAEVMVEAGPRNTARSMICATLRSAKGSLANSFSVALKMAVSVALFPLRIRGRSRNRAEVGPRPGVEDATFFSAR